MRGLGADDSPTGGFHMQVQELKAALAGKKQGVMATLVREAAEPLREQESQVQALRKEVQQQRSRADEVRPRPLLCEVSRRAAVAPTQPGCHKTFKCH
jgi:hypothetical protein